LKNNERTSAFLVCNTQVIILQLAKLACGQRKRGLLREGGDPLRVHAKSLLKAVSCFL